MNNRRICTKSIGNTNPDFTVASEEPSVSKASGNRAVRRRSFRKSLNSSQVNTSERPARIIKLNRSIFNDQSTAKPAFRVKKTTDERNDDKIGKKAKEQVNTTLSRPKRSKVSDNDISSLEDVEHSVVPCLPSLSQMHVSTSILLASVEGVAVNTSPMSVNSSENSAVTCMLKSTMVPTSVTDLSTSVSEVSINPGPMLSRVSNNDTLSTSNVKNSSVARIPNSTTVPTSMADLSNTVIEVTVHPGSTSSKVSDNNSLSINNVNNSAASCMPNSTLLPTSTAPPSTPVNEVTVNVGPTFSKVSDNDTLSTDSVQNSAVSCMLNSTSLHTSTACVSTSVSEVTVSAGPTSSEVSRDDALLLKNTENSTISKAKPASSVDVLTPANAMCVNAGIIATKIRDNDTLSINNLENSPVTWVPSTKLMPASKVGNLAPLNYVTVKTRPPSRKVKVDDACTLSMNGVDNSTVDCMPSLSSIRSSVKTHLASQFHTVIKCKKVINTPLLLPRIELKRLSKDQCKHALSNVCDSAKTVSVSRSSRPTLKHRSSVRKRKKINSVCIKLPKALNKVKYKLHTSMNATPTQATLVNVLPAIMNASSTLTNPLPTLTNPLPTVTNPLPTLTTALPSLTTALPTTTTALPTPTNSLSTITNALPTHVTVPPTQLNKSPTLKNTLPTLTNASPTLKNPSPTLTNASSTPTNASPTPTKASPTLTNASSTQTHLSRTPMNVSPTLTNASPNQMNVLPTLLNESPTLINATPTLMNIPPCINSSSSKKASLTVINASTTSVSASSTINAYLSIPVNASPPINTLLTAVNTSPTVVNASRTVKSASPTKAGALPRVINVSQSTLPLKKRKVSPVRSSDSELITPKVHNASPLKKRKVSPIRSPDHGPSTPDAHNNPVRPPSTPSPLDCPPSPVLSLGEQSDNDFENEGKSPLKNHRLTTMTKPEDTFVNKSQEYSKMPSQIQQTKSLKKTITIDAHQRQAISRSFVDDSLDVMSVIADDDGLFVEEKPDDVLKPSTPQNSTFSITDETNDRGSLTTLESQTAARQNQSLSDLISSKPFRTSRWNSEEGSDKLGVDTNLAKNSFEGQFDSCLSASCGNGTYLARNNLASHSFPKSTRVVSHDSRPLNGISVQEKIRWVNRSLGAADISEAWSAIKQLDENKTDIDIRMLEETVKVCEQVSRDRPSHVAVEVSTGVFNMLEHRKALKPMAYILTFLTLCRCGKFEKAFEKMSAMDAAKVFPPRTFFNDVLHCLKRKPKWIFELLPFLKLFNASNPTHLVNSCLSSLVAAPVDLLKEISSTQWDTLISLLSFSRNVQGAVQVQSIIDKHCITISDQSISMLLNLYRDTKCTKQLLDLVHSKCNKQTFDVAFVFADNSLKLRDVDAHIKDLMASASLPQEDVLHYFIEKASSLKEFRLIHNLFQNSKKFRLPLSVAILKEMVDALENWDENLTAAVDVYTALRHAKVTHRKEQYMKASNLPQTSLEVKKSRIRCRLFQQNGRCSYGERCKFSHAVNEQPKHFKSRPNSSSTGEPPKYNSNDAMRQRNDSTNTPLRNGCSSSCFPSFPNPSYVVPMFNSAPNNPIPTLSQPLRQPMPTIPRFQARNVNSMHGFAPKMSRSPVMPFLVSSVDQPLTTARQVKLNRSFSWEPASSRKTQVSPITGFHRPCSNIDADQNKDMQQRLDQAVAAKNWSDIYLCYVELKQANNSEVQANDLRTFRTLFLKDASVLSSSFSDFINFMHEEKSPPKRSSYDGSSDVGGDGDGSISPFDEYDTKFLGSIAVSLMEKYLVAKKFEKGYMILHSLHALNISYFDCGTNFGFYIKDIPPSSIAIIAVKLCMGVSHEEGLLGAVEVLRASNYARPEDSLAQDSIEHRIKVLQRLVNRLYHEGNISEAFEILQHMKASASVMLPLYVKVLRYYASIEDFDHSFKVLAEMNENGFNLNIPESQNMCEKFMKVSLTNNRDDEALSALKYMKSVGIILSGDIWQGILNHVLTTTREVLTNQLFQQCVSLDVYPTTFSENTPWLCQLGCGYSRLEIRLLIVNHLKQLHKYLAASTQCAVPLSSLNDFQITLFPRLSKVAQTFSQGIQTAMKKNILTVKQILEEDLNPPLNIAKKTQEQFHSNFIVDTVSLNRWFIGNCSDGARGGHGRNDSGDDMSCGSSIESCVSYMTRMTEFD